MLCNLSTNLLSYENTSTFLKFSYLQCKRDTLDTSYIYVNKAVGKVVFSFYGFVGVNIHTAIFSCLTFHKLTNFRVEGNKSCLYSIPLPSLLLMKCLLEHCKLVALALGNLDAANLPEQLKNCAISQFWPFTKSVGNFFEYFKKILRNDITFYP